MPDLDATTWNAWLVEHEACPPGLDFCEGKTLQESWETLPNGGWMLWVAVEAGLPLRRIMRLAADCVEMWSDDNVERQELMVQVRAWIRGEITVPELKTAVAVATTGPFPEELTYPVFYCAAIPWTVDRKNSADRSVHRDTSAESAAYIRSKITLQEIYDGVTA